MSQLKRKSLDASSEHNGDDGPNKRLKADDNHENHGSRSPSPTERRVHDSPPRRPEHRDSETSRRNSRRDSEISRRGSVTVIEKDRNSRDSFSQEEKKRGKRLFGGLLSTLSQTTNNSQQKRRQEVEKRQQERAAKQRIKDDKRRSERLAKLNKTRKVEQVRFDEQVVRDDDGELYPRDWLTDRHEQMRTRHSYMRSMAHCLQSKSEPKLVSNMDYCCTMITKKLTNSSTIALGNSHQSKKTPSKTRYETSRPRSKTSCSVSINRKSRDLRNWGC